VGEPRRPQRRHLDAGRATLELLSSSQTAVVDEIEGGASPAIRLAFEVDDPAGTADRLEEAGARRLGGPVVTPWQHRNVRLEAPGAQLTLFTVLGSGSGRGGGEAAQAEPGRGDVASPRPPGSGRGGGEAAQAEPGRGDVASPRPPG
jgi:hypothetical protein